MKKKRKCRLSVHIIHIYMYINKLIINTYILLNKQLLYMYISV